MVDSTRQLHLGMALDAVIGGKGVLALAMASATGLAFFHVSHGGLSASDAVGEDLGVAVSAFVTLQVELMAEGCFSGRLGNHVVDDPRFEPLVTLGTISGCSENQFAVMTGSAGFALGHVVHGRFANDRLIGEDLGVAVLAGVGSGMDIVTERCRGDTLELEDDILRSQASVAFCAVSGRGENVFAVVTGAAGFAVSHVGHGGLSDDRFIGEYLGVAVLTGIGGGMDGVAEGGRPDALEIEDDLLRLDDSLVTALTVGRYTE